MDEKINGGGDEIDIRDLALTIFSQWKIILVITVSIGISAFLVSKIQKPEFQSTSQVFIDQKSLMLSLNPVKIFTSDDCLQQTAEILSLTQKEILTSQNINAVYNENILTITVSGPDPILTTNIANSLTESGIKLINQSIDNVLITEERFRQNIFTAENQLIDYLKINKLSQYSWAELSALTGFGQLTNADPFPEVVLPQFSSKQKLEISKLMQAQIDAQQDYSILRLNTITLKIMSIINPLKIIQSTNNPGVQISRSWMVITILGIIVGFALGICFVFLRKWWEDSLK